jgi:hypothetical protein
MQARNGSDKAKPETVSRCATTRLQPVKTLEHVLVFSSGNSRSIIGNRNNGSAFAAFCNLNGYVPRWATMFDRIVNEIGDRIKDEIAIACDANFLIANKA